MFSLLYGPSLTSVHDYWKNLSFDFMDLCQQSDVLVFNRLSRFVIAFLPRGTNAEETEIEQFYEDLQDLLELTPKKRKRKNVLFIKVTGMQK